MTFIYRQIKFGTKENQWLIYMLCKLYFLDSKITHNNY